MCVAASGRVVSIEGDKALVEVSGSSIAADIGLVDAKPGDAVLLHAGCVLQVLTESDHEALTALWEELGGSFAAAMES